MIDKSQRCKTLINFQFRATEARDSMESFMEGLFSSRTAIFPEESSLNDTLLTVSASLFMRIKILFEFH
jgi:hypothetical protein